MRTRQILIVVTILMLAVASALAEQPSSTPREQFIEDIIRAGESVSKKAGNRPQRAHYAGDIYVCKNFTKHVFNEVKSKYRIKGYEDVALVVPDNLSKELCAPYGKGFMWEYVPVEQGNPFYMVAEFKYDPEKTKQENVAAALDFMRYAERGDYFQMNARYEYGTGPHSAIILRGVCPGNDTIRWMDSNMNGFKKEGIRYGYVQFDAVAPITWLADAFCKPNCGASIYRLRDDIVFAD